MPNITISVTDEDLAKILKLTGESKNATAIKEALSRFLDDRGETNQMVKGAGGYRVENTPAYKAGFAWGKQAAEEKRDIDMWSDGAALDSQDDFETWLTENYGWNSKIYQKKFDEWCKGTLDGWLAGGGAFPHDTRKFRSTDGITNAK